MSLPAPVLWVFGLLLAWLVLQVIADLMVRPRRVRLKVLVAALKADDRYGEKDHAMIDQALDEAAPTSWS